MKPKDLCSCCYQPITKQHDPDGESSNPPKADEEADLESVKPELVQPGEQPTSAQTGYNKGVVSTDDAKGASTDKTKEDLKLIADSLLKLTERDEQLKELAKLKENIHEETRHFLYLTRRRELEHVELMEKMLNSSTFEGLVRANLKEKRHDYSKDDLFFFVAPAYYDGGLQTPEMKEFVDKELRRHHTLEPHHPEFEKYNDGKECGPVDILEMAIDRLARNVQFGNGHVDKEVMQKFLPIFELGDNDAKRQAFSRHVTKYAEFVQSSFIEMYPEAKDWAPD